MSRIMRAIIVILIAQLVSAQQAGQAPSSSPRGTYKFEATTQLVVVNVSAKDKNGDPVEGLKATDFTITEDGRPQAIKVFEYQRLEDTLLPSPALAQREAAVSPSVKPAVASQIAPAKPGEVKYKDRRLLVLFFDQARVAVR